MVVALICSRAPLCRFDDLAKSKHMNLPFANIVRSMQGIAYFALGNLTRYTPLMRYGTKYTTTYRHIRYLHVLVTSDKSCVFCLRRL